MRRSSQTGRPAPSRSRGTALRPEREAREPPVPHRCGMQISDRARRTLALLIAAGTLPYLALKANWLAGGTAGIRDAALLADPSVRVLNVVTVLMDVLVIALALALLALVGAASPASRPASSASAPDRTTGRAEL